MKSPIIEGNQRFLVQIISTQKLIRSDSLIAELSRQKIHYEISDGVRITNEDFENFKFHDKKITELLCRRSLTAGEVGCALAHKQASKNLLKSNNNFGIVFEDDAEIIDNIDFSVLSNKLDTAKPTIVFLGWIPGYAVASQKQRELDNAIVEVITPPTCAFAYALNKSAANKIAGVSDVVLDLADWPINLLKETAFYVLQTPWATAPQDPELSTIGHRVTKTKSGPLSKLKGIKSLVVSVFYVNFLARKNNLDLSIGQVTHRLITRDFIYRQGLNTLNKSSINQLENGIVFKKGILIWLARVL